MDSPGHRLTRAHPDNQYGYAGVGEALERVMVELELDNIVLLGHSMGGWVAWRYTPPSAALSFGEQINNLITVMLPEAGHLLMLEATAAVAQAVK